MADCPSNYIHESLEAIFNCPECDALLTEMEISE